MKKINCGISTSIVESSGTSNYTVRIRVSYGGKRVDLRPGITLESKDQWKDHRVKRGCNVDGVGFNIINRRLSQCEDLVEDYFEQCEENSLDPSLDELRLWFNAEVSKTVDSDEPTVLPRLQVARKSFFELYKEFIEYMNARLKRKTCKAESIEPYLHLKNRLYEYDKTISLESLTAQKMDGFICHLAKTMFNESILKYLKYLKCFVEWADEEGYSVNKEYYRYQVVLKKCVKQVRFLTIEEIEILWNLELNTSALRETRDLFVFQCYTALRYSDLKTLRRENFVYHGDGNLYLRKETLKCRTVVDFRLPIIAKIIYERYNNHLYKGGLVFPVISNQKYNRHLKELGRMAKLQGQWKDIHYRLDKQEISWTDKADLESHIGRRSFICMAYNEGMELERIAAITGHKHIEDLKPYIQAMHKLTDPVIDAIDEMDKDRSMKIVETNRTVA